MTNIIVALIKFIKNIGNFLLPDVLFQTDVFLNIAEYMDFFVDMVCMVNFLVPLPTLFSCLVIIVGIRIAKIVIFVQNWLIRSALEIIP